MEWVERIQEARKMAKTIEDIEYIEDKIRTSPQRPNYRTNAGRETRDLLLSQCHEKALQFIKEGAEPF
jgi:hypothetical protein